MKTIYGTEGAQGAEDYIGAAHARIGLPVCVRIARGNNSTTMHLSMAEATQLHEALTEARKGKAA